MSLERKIKVQDFTKDATAVQGDVRTGKIFYNNFGKQTGIWSPKVTDFTGDATASEGDVRTGKTFYNSEGKKLGIWTPTPQEIITDATALPEDVAEGKVFYNNEGRQVGTGTVLHSKTVSLTKGTEYKKIKSYNNKTYYATSYQFVDGQYSGTVEHNKDRVYSFMSGMSVQVDKKPSWIKIYSPGMRDHNHFVMHPLQTGTTPEIIEWFDSGYERDRPVTACDGEDMCWNDMFGILYINNMIYLGTTNDNSPIKMTPNYDIEVTIYE